MVILRKTRKKTSLIWTLSKEQLQKDIQECQNLAQVLKRHGLCPIGGTPKILKERLNQDRIDFSHFKMGFKSNLGRHFNYALSPEEALKIVFIVGSKAAPKTVRQYMIRYQFLPYQCQCGNKGEWQDKKLSLQLDHINGINNDHRIDNLRWLCPNCHSQTATFGSKNR